MEVLTHTRLQTRKNCPKMDYWRNIRGLVPIRKKQSLNIGGAFHIGMETRSVEKAVMYMRNSSVPANQEEAEELELAVAIVEGMITGALQRWPRLGIENYPEQKFEVPIFNPATGSASKSFRLGGKTDELLRLEDGTWWLMEYKTASQIGQAYIERLDLDSQITTYIHGLQLKYPEIVISGVFYRIAKKPSIRQTKKETFEEFRQRVIRDYQERPDFYFFEQQLYRSQKDLQEFREELWGFTQEYLFAKRSGIHYKNTSRCTEYGRCPYIDLCRGVEGAEHMFRTAVQNEELLDEGDEQDGTAS
ncbi:PD-(D/E)XK nuclease family protein [Paenibacillus melissococcoides]|nr:PD-(D/E)XK nuclease family protein [Paenibacillus melissococcoides]MEB9892995.1 PD-(D/E)XK nuclease family protein [Bacillus cereus]CAH8705010.1 PD-(D/E)XK nuclease family protein [Paenibacillus melissococcoides]CAH8708237.1 PD-(D/E)XK nuclease family protein [Paenibacillus melissococcoides]CAH8717429.1 PD-(D/E)XK nuclease family protein [Paenibacillus melissococcoides]CAH8718416.1 PD-(D/E)XK nuclease family protein [Paenibacillus melissococcoides]